MNNPVKVEDRRPSEGFEVGTELNQDAQEGDMPRDTILDGPSTQMRRPSESFTSGSAAGEIKHPLYKR